MNIYSVMIQNASAISEDKMGLSMSRVWPPGSSSTEPALARLGAWGNEDAKIIDMSSSTSCRRKGSYRPYCSCLLTFRRIYPQAGPLLQTTASAILSLATMLMFWASHACRSPISRLRLETNLQQEGDAGNSKLACSHRFYYHSRYECSSYRASRYHSTVVKTMSPSDVCHNDRRERVRNFVWEAISRLAYREDVAGIVINAHSNGTVISFDLLRYLRRISRRRSWRSSLQVVLCVSMLTCSTGAMKLGTSRRSSSGRISGTRKTLWQIPWIPLQAGSVKHSASLEISSDCISSSIAIQEQSKGFLSRISRSITLKTALAVDCRPTTTGTTSPSLPSRWPKH